MYSYYQKWVWGSTPLLRKINFYLGYNNCVSRAYDRKLVRRWIFCWEITNLFQDRGLMFVTSRFVASDATSLADKH